MSEQAYNEILNNINKLFTISERLLKMTKADIEKIQSILAEYQPLNINAVSLDRVIKE